MTKTIAVFGANGGIGKALVDILLTEDSSNIVYAFSSQAQTERQNLNAIQLAGYSEASIEAAINQIPDAVRFDLVVVASGFLHNAQVKPEKSLKNVSELNFETLFQANTIFPALIIKHLCAKLGRDNHSVMAILSARVGSISDNRLGGWYAYRASKAALNMIIKTASIELKRSNKKAMIVGLHPGTVDSNLSKPFQSNVPSDKLFSAQQSASYLLQVVSNLNIDDTGNCFAWDGKEIQP
jgi:NAD(P)-dependent dehydrogenase (short-subunit alcohol dehydrogenase family)